MDTLNEIFFKYSNETIIVILDNNKKPWSFATLQPQKINNKNQRFLLFIFWGSMVRILLKY
jgi:hypothetical protein